MKLSFYRKTLIVLFEVITLFPVYINIKGFIENQFYKWYEWNIFFLNWRLREFENKKDKIVVV